MIKTIKIIAIFIFALCFFGTSYAQDQSKDKTTSIKIKSYPQPTYTPEAAAKKVSGTVYLRVTFLETGKLGKIVELTEKNNPELRQYGLIEKAIEAARTIKFEPAVKDGKKITVTKVIAFKFDMH